MNASLKKTAIEQNYTNVYTPTTDTGRIHMKKPRRKTILCSLLAIVFLTLLVQYVAFAVNLDFGRDKLNPLGTNSSNTSATKRPNITAAQKLTAQAYDKVVAAQNANEWDMAGHAQKAKSLLEQVNAELKLAAEATNQSK
jgi:hypothetical protein